MSLLSNLFRSKRKKIERAKINLVLMMFKTTENTEKEPEKESS